MEFYVRKSFGMIAGISLVILASGLYELHTLNVAHSSFENYYAFRGCVQLLEKNENYAICKLPSEETIKLVKVGTDWFLDGNFGW
jgi:hypothetical protein